MIPSCLYDLVQWRDICTSDSPTSIFINDLPGFPEDAFELLTDKNFDTGEKVWAKLQKRALLKLTTAISTTLNEKFEARTIIETIETGRWKQPFEALPTENYWKGLYLDISGSKNLQIYVQNVQLYTPIAATDSIRVFNLDTGALLDTINFTISAGFQTISIEKAYEGNRIFLAYDGALIPSREVYQHGESYYDEVCEPCKCKVTQGYEVKVLKSGDVIYHNLDYEYSSGMIANYSIQCSLNNWICRNKNHFQLTLQMLLGLEMGVEISASERVNELTLRSEEKLDAFLDYCNNGYKATLKNFLKGVKIKDRICVPCAPKVMKTYRIP